MCFDFLYNFCSETFFIIGGTERDMINNVYWSSCAVPLIPVIFEWNLNFLDRFSKKKNSKIKFRKNPSSESRVVPCGQTDGHDETKCRFSWFYERTWKMFIISDTRKLAERPHCALLLCSLVFNYVHKSKYTKCIFSVKCDSFLCTTLVQYIYFSYIKYWLCYVWFNPHPANVENMVSS